MISNEVKFHNTKNSETITLNLDHQSKLYLGSC